jgi:acyl carrier protein
MENLNSKCLNIVIKVIEDYKNEMNINTNKIEESTRLIGSNSPFDSSDLVQIIVEVEDKINDEFKTEIILTDEKAMSRTTSPFVNIATLVDFIVENLN